jgi:hypothetical protein
MRWSRARNFPEFLLFDGAKLMGERVFDVGASSSSIPGNGATKLVGGAVMIV